MRQHRFVSQWRLAKRRDTARLFARRQRNTISPDMWQTGNSPAECEDRRHAALRRVLQRCARGDRMQPGNRGQDREARSEGRVERRLAETAKSFAVDISMISRLR